MMMLQNLDNNSIELHNCNSWTYHDGNQFCVKTDGTEVRVDAVNTGGGDFISTANFWTGFGQETKPALLNLDNNSIEFHNCVSWTYHDGFQWCVKRDGTQAKVDGVNTGGGDFISIGNFGNGFDDEKKPGTLLNLDG